MSELAIIEYNDEELDNENSCDQNEEVKSPIEVKVNVKKSSKKYGRRFKNSWETDDRFKNWVIRSANNLPFCKYCATELKATAGTKDLQCHLKSNKHQNNLAIFIRENNISAAYSNGAYTWDDSITETFIISELENERKENNTNDDIANAKSVEENSKQPLGKKCTQPLEMNTCKLCGNTFLNLNNYSNKQLNALGKFMNIENEKKDIQLKMREFIEKMEDPTKSKETSAQQAFARILNADMTKLSPGIQRKLKINIMQQVDKELEKLEQYN